MTTIYLPLEKFCLL